MSWESYTLMKCKKCGKVYEVEDSTLIMNMKGYDRCQVCRSEGEIVSSRSMLDKKLVKDIIEVINMKDVKQIKCK